MSFDLLPPALLDIPAASRGDLLVHGTSSWQRLPKGSNGQMLRSGAADPAWAWHGWIGRSIASLNTRLAVNSVIPGDDSIPQVTEGVELLTVSHTPRDAAHILRVTAIIPHMQLGVVSEATGIGAIFRDAAPDARAASLCALPGAHNTQLMIQHEETAGSTAATSFKLRLGTAENVTIYVNGNASSRMFGGVLRTLLIVDEYAP